MPRQSHVVQHPAGKRHHADASGRGPGGRQIRETFRQHQMKTARRFSHGASAPAQMQHPEEKAGRVKLKQAVPTFAPHKGRVAGRQIVRDAVPVT